MQEQANLAAFLAQHLAHGIDDERPVVEQSLDDGAGGFRASGLPDRRDPNADRAAAAQEEKAEAFHHQVDERGHVPSGQQEIGRLAEKLARECLDQRALGAAGSIAEQGEELLQDGWVVSRTAAPADLPSNLQLLREVGPLAPSGGRTLPGLQSTMRSGRAGVRTAGAPRSGRPAGPAMRQRPRRFTAPGRRRQLGIPAPRPASRCGPGTAEFRCRRRPGVQRRSWQPRRRAFCRARLASDVPPVATRVGGDHEGFDPAPHADRELARIGDVDEPHHPFPGQGDVKVGAEVARQPSKAPQYGTIGRGHGQAAGAHDAQHSDEIGTPDAPVPDRSRQHGSGCSMGRSRRARRQEADDNRWILGPGF